MSEDLQNAIFEDLADKLECTYKKIKTIFDDPESFVESKDIHDSEITPEKLSEEIKKLASSANKNDDKVINLFKDMIIAIFKTLEIIPSFDGFEEYINSYCSIISTTKPCNKFIDNTDVVDDDPEPKLVPVVIFLSMLECANCRHTKDDHAVCNKYYVKDNNSCKTCGRSDFEHVVCDSYKRILEPYDSCANCGLDKYHHLKKIKESGKSHCGNFSRNASDKTECNNCVFNMCEHIQSEKYIKLNNEQKLKVTQLSIEFNIDSNDAINRAKSAVKSSGLASDTNIFIKNMINLKNQVDSLLYVSNYEKIAENLT